MFYRFFRLHNPRALGKLTGHGRGGTCKTTLFMVGEQEKRCQKPAKQEKTSGKCCQTMWKWGCFTIFWWKWSIGKQVRVEARSLRVRCIFECFAGKKCFRTCMSINCSFWKKLVPFFAGYGWSFYWHAGCEVLFCAGAGCGLVGNMKTLVEPFHEWM